MGKFQYLNLRRSIACVYQPLVPVGSQATRIDAVDLEFANGVGDNQCDLLYAKTLTIAASGNSDLRLNDNSLKDPFGGDLTFAKVRGILIKAAPGNTNEVILKPSSSNGFLGPFSNASHTQNVKKGASWYSDAPVGGWTVDGTHHSINLANSSSGSTVTFDIVIVGTSA